MVAHKIAFLLFFWKFLTAATTQREISDGDHAAVDNFPKKIKYEDMKKRLMQG